MTTKGVDTKMARLETKMDYVAESLEENKQQHKEIMETLNKFVESAPSKFASKTTEDRVKALEIENNSIKIWIGGIAAGAIVIFYVIDLALNYFRLI